MSSSLTKDRAALVLPVVRWDGGRLQPLPAFGRGRDLRVNPRQTREPEILKGTPAPHRCLASLADDADAPIRQCSQICGYGGGVV